MIESTLKVSPASTSVSLERTSTVTGVSSSVVAESSTASGGLLVGAVGVAQGTVFLPLG